MGLRSFPKDPPGSGPSSEPLQGSVLFHCLRELRSFQMSSVGLGATHKVLGELVGLGAKHKVLGELVVFLVVSVG